jgi:short-subunit dehydrogenase
MGDRLSGRLVLVTGASAGIGRAAARELVRRGCRVVAAARDAARLEELAHELGGHERLLPVATDVARGGAMDRFTRRVLDEVGLPDVIVANAGIGLDALLSETTDDALRRLFEVNVFGVVRTVRPFLPAMVDRGSGRIVIVSSVVGKRGIPHYSAYSASKFALHGMADSLRAELYGSGVTVGLVCPSTTVSEFGERLMRNGPSQRQRRLRAHSAESVARTIARMADSKRREIVLSPEGRFLVFADAVAPGLVDRLLARVLTRRRAS